MPADLPTILATSGGLTRGSRTDIAFAPLVLFAIELAGVEARRPRLCQIRHGRRRPTLVQCPVGRSRSRGGNRRRALEPVSDAECRGRGRVPARPGCHLGQRWQRCQSARDLAAARARPDPCRSLAGRCCSRWGVRRLSVLARRWYHRLLRPDPTPCDKRPRPAPVPNGVHYDSEPQRRPLFHKLIANGVLGDGYASDDGVGLLYRDTTLVEAVTEMRGKGAYSVRRDGDRAVEDRIEPRTLPGAF